ncbi:MAG TPA: helix-turn-helix domain-containing protein [Afipia sp.]
MPTRDAWSARIWREFHAGNLSRGFRDALLALATYRSRGGTAWPSHGTIAERARCGVATVRRALRHAAALGLLTWSERRRRAGWRSLRSSNLYRFIVPDQPVTAGQRPVWWRRRTDDHRDRAEIRDSKKTALEGLLEAARHLPDLLAARRQAVMAQLGAG